MSFLTKCCNALAKVSVKNNGVQTIATRGFAKKVVRKFNKKKKKVLAPEIEHVKITGPDCPPQPELFPAHSENPITSSHLNICNVGFHSVLKGKKLFVYGISDAQKEFEITSDNENRFMTGFGNPSKPYVIRAFPRNIPGQAFRIFLRKKGYIPAVINHVTDSSKHMKIYVDPLELENLPYATGAHAGVAHIDVAGYSERVRCLIRNISVDGVTRKLAHLQFIAITPNRKWDATYPVAFFGESESIGIKHGGIIIQPNATYRGVHDPAIGGRIGHHEAHTGVAIDIVDRGVNQTFRAFQMPRSVFSHLPKDSKQNNQVLFAFTKKLG